MWRLRGKENLLRHLLDLRANGLAISDARIEQVMREWMDIRRELQGDADV